MSNILYTSLVIISVSSTGYLLLFKSSALRTTNKRVNQAHVHTYYHYVFGACGPGQLGTSGGFFRHEHGDRWVSKLQDCPRVHVHAPFPCRMWPATHLHSANNDAHSPASRMSHTRSGRATPPLRMAQLCTHTVSSLGFQHVQYTLEQYTVLRAPTTLSVVCSRHTCHCVSLL